MPSHGWERRGLRTFSVRQKSDRLLLARERNGREGRGVTKFEVLLTGLVIISQSIIQMDAFAITKLTKPKIQISKSRDDPRPPRVLDCFY